MVYILLIQIAKSRLFNILYPIFVYLNSPLCLTIMAL